MSRAAADGSRVRLCAAPPNDVRPHDFVEDRTHDGRTFGMLCFIDEFGRQASTILFRRRLRRAESGQW
jgi:hypothetical protein